MDNGGMDRTELRNRMTQEKQPAGRLLLFWRGARKNAPTWKSLADPPPPPQRHRWWRTLALALLVAALTAVAAYALMDANRPAVRAVLTHIAG